MDISTTLARLAELASTSEQPAAALSASLDLITAAIAAQSCLLVYVTETGFEFVGDSEEFTPTALWFIQRDLTSHTGPRSFGRTGARVHAFQDASLSPVQEYVAMLLPVPGVMSAQFLILKGGVEAGPDEHRRSLLIAAAPALSVLVQRSFYADQAARERDHLAALMNVSQLVSESGDLEQGLTKMARAVAAMINVEFCTIDLLDESAQVTLRAVNYELPKSTDGHVWRQAARQPDPLRDEVWRTRRPITIDDITSDERVHPAVRAFFSRVLVRSVAIVPLVERGLCIGVYAIAATRPITFDAATMDLFESVGRQVATVVSGVRLYNELAEKSALLERALQLAREHARRDSLTGVLNHAAIAEVAAARVTAAHGNNYFGVAMVDVDGMKTVNDTYGHVSGDGVLSAVAATLEHDGAIVGRYGGDEFLVVLPGAHRTRMERYRDEAMDRIAEAKVIDAATSATIRIKISVGICMFPGEAGSLSEVIAGADKDMYTVKSRHALTDPDNARHLDARVSSTIADLVPLLTSSGKLEEKLKRVAERLSSGPAYDVVDCQIFSDDGPLAESTLSGAREDSLTARWLEEQRRGDGRNRDLNVILARTRRPLILEDLSSDQRLSEAERQLLAAAGLQSAILVPMLWDNSLIGTLSVAKRDKAAFGVPDAQFLSAVASQVTGMVRMASLIEGMQEATERLTNSQAETVLMLAAAAEAHDSTTGRHLENMRALSEILACEMGYDEERVRALGLAATLHDIGKISVPDTVLSSSLRFDSDDFEIGQMREVMKRHSVWGAEFLAGRPGFELATKVARWHHERWDGSGYPDGLRGNAIPEEVAIISVADAFDAMVSDRPYRSGRPASAAVSEIVAWSGKQFSPIVVQALVRAWQAGHLPGTGDDQSRAAA